MGQNKIILGDAAFDDGAAGNLIGCRCFIGNSIACDELSIDTLNATIDVAPSGGQDAYNISQLQYGDPVSYLYNDQLIGRFFFLSSKRVGRRRYELSCTSAIGLLDRLTHYGGVYNGAAMSAVLADIVGEMAEYTLDPLFDNVTIHGWLPIGTRRENLHQLLFVSGASVRKNGDGTLNFTALSEEHPFEVSDDRLFLGGTVDYPNPATLAYISEHTYIAYEQDETATLYEGEIPSERVLSPLGAVLLGVLVAFDDPMHGLSVDGGAILESGVNYAVLGASGHCKLTGKKYTHTTRVITSQEPKRRGLAEIKDSTVTVSDATLVSLANSENVAQRVLAYYSAARTIKNDMLVGAERPGDPLALTDPFGDPAAAFLKSLDISASRILRAAAEMVVGYVPTGIGNYYQHSVVLTGTGMWTVPKECKGKIRVAVISGGRGGFSGGKGRAGTPGKKRTWQTSVTGATTNLSEQAAGSGGAGGIGGAGGSGGYIYEMVISVEAKEVFHYLCGAGGEGGAASNADDTFLPGSDGVHSRFGEINSSAGTRAAQGYLNPLTGARYGYDGEIGLSGGNGSGLLEDGETVAAGNPVVVDGTSYIPGKDDPTEAEDRYSWNNGGDYHDSTYALGRGGFGGGAAAGGNGSAAGAPDAATARTYVHGTGGKGGDGANATLTPAAQPHMGCGGIGGYGGGGGGGNGYGGARYTRHKTSTGSSPGSLAGQSYGPGAGGMGSAGGRGSPGCVIVYY